MLDTYTLHPKTLTSLPNFLHPLHFLSYPYSSTTPSLLMFAHMTIQVTAQHNNLSFSQETGNYISAQNVSFTSLLELARTYTHATTKILLYISSLTSTGLNCLLPLISHPISQTLTLPKEFICTFHSCHLSVWQPHLSIWTIVHMYIHSLLKHLNDYPNNALHYTTFTFASLTFFFFIGDLGSSNLHFDEKSHWSTVLVLPRIRPLINDSCWRCT